MAQKQIPIERRVRDGIGAAGTFLWVLCFGDPRHYTIFRRTMLQESLSYWPTKVGPITKSPLA